MPELTLSLEEDFWTVGIPLIDLLDNLANQTEQTVDVNTPEKYLFGDENLAWKFARDAHKQVVAQEKKVELHKTEAQHFKELRVLYELEKEQGPIDQEKQKQQDIIQEITPRLDEVNKNITDIEESMAPDVPQDESYKALVEERTDLSQKLEGANEKLSALNNLQTSIDLQNEELRKVRQQLYSTETIPNVMPYQELGMAELQLPERLKKAETLLAQHQVQEATETTKAKLATAEKNKVRDKMRKQVVELKVFKQIAEDNEHKTENEREKIDFQVLQKSLNDMAEVTPGLYKELIQDVNQNFAAAELDKKREEVKQTLVNNFNDMKANESRNIKIQTDLGVGLSAVAAGARVTISGVRTIGVSVDSYNQYTVTKGWDVAAGFMAFGGAAVDENLNAQLLGGGDVDFNNSTSIAYGSLEDMIDAESGNISTTFLDFDLNQRSWRFFEKRNNKRTQKEAVDHQKLAQSNWSRLQKNLNLVGILTEQQQVTIPQLKKVNYTRTKSHGLSGDAYGGATLRIGNHFGVGGGFQLNGSYTTSYDSKTIHLIDDVVNEPTLGKIYARRHPGYFGFTLTDTSGQDTTYSGQDAIEVLEQMEAQIDELQKKVPQNDPEKLAKETQIQALRKQLTNALGKLSYDYQLFVRLENEAQRKTMGSKETLNGLRATRAVKDSASYLKAVSLQYANLKRAYNKTFADDEAFTYDESKFSEHMQDFERDLKTPLFKISKTDYAKAFDITEETGNSLITTIGAELMLGNLRGINEYTDNDGAKFAQATTSGVRVGLKHSASTDPEGYETETMNINFNVPNEVGTFGTNFVANILNLDDIKKLLKPRPKDASDPDSNDPATNDETPDADMGLIEEVLKEAVLRADGGNVDVQLFRKNKGFEIKYVRGYAASNKKIGGTGIIPVVPGTNIRLGGSVALNQKSLVYERPGDNTLSYLTTLYTNGQIQVNDNLPSYEEATGVVNYDEEHQLLDKMLTNLKNADSNISDELEVWFDEMKKYHSDEADAEAAAKRKNLMDKTKQKLALFRAAPDSDTEAKENFKDAFTQFVGQRNTDEGNYYNQLFHTRRTAVAKDMRTYAGDLIVERVNHLIETHGIPNESADSIESMKKWAKKRYGDAVNAKKANTDGADQELQNSFEVLKAVFAVDYASKTLEDLIASEGAADQEKALSLLGTQLDVLLEPQEKVYLDKGLTGRLEQAADGTLKIKPIIAKENDKRLADATIARKVEAQMSGVEYTPLPTVKIDELDEEVTLKKVTLHPIRQLSSRVSARLGRSRSARSAINLFGGNKKTISDYIAQVMQKSLAQRRQAQAQKPKNAAASK